MEHLAKGETPPEAFERGPHKLEIRILDRSVTLPPEKVANFSRDGDLIRNVAVLRTGLQSLYEEVKALERKLPKVPHSSQGFDVNGIYGQLAVKFDWFSISMLNLMEGISLLDTLAREGDYAQLTSGREGMERIQSLARQYTNSIPEAEALRLWRNKVAAHRSGIALGRKSDSLTTRLVSLMGAQVQAKNGRYVAPGAIPYGNWPISATPELKEWSLTETWEDLVSERYPWLNDGSFFSGVNALSIGTGASLYGISVRNLTEQEIEQLKAGFLPDFGPEAGMRNTSEKQMTTE